MVVQIDKKEREPGGYAPYVSAGGRSLRAERRTAPGPRARWSELPAEERHSRPVNDEELALLFETSRRLIAARVRRMLRWLKDPEIVEEAVQVAFVEAILRRPERRPMPLRWLTTVAYRRAITLAQRKAREDPEGLELAVLVEERMGHGHAPEVGLWLEATELLEAVAALPERQRRVIELAAAGFTREETAERVGGTVRGVEGRLGRARRALREQLAA